MKKQCTLPSEIDNSRPDSGLNKGQIESIYISNFQFINKKTSIIGMIKKHLGSPSNY